MSAEPGIRERRGSPAAARSPPASPRSRRRPPTRSCSPAARPRPGARRRKWSPPAPRSRAPSPRGCGSPPTPPDLADCDVVVEAIVEEVAPKGELLATVAEACPNADLATTTSSLSIAEIAEAGGIRPALRPPRLQPGAADEAGRGLLPRRRRPAPARRRSPGARRSARPRSRSPTRPASSSTACSSPTSSTRCG